MTFYLHFPKFFAFFRRLFLCISQDLSDQNSFLNCQNFSLCSFSSNYRLSALLAQHISQQIQSVQNPLLLILIQILQRLGKLVAGVVHRLGADLPVAVGH